MRAGKLDRIVTLRRYVTVGKNPLGESIKEWSDVIDLPAQQRPNRGDERFAAQQLSGSAVMTFHVRYRDDISVEDRLFYDGREWNITDVREVGRNKLTEIDAVARQD